MKMQMRVGRVATNCRSNHVCRCPSLVELADRQNLIAVFERLRCSGEATDANGVHYADLNHSEACKLARSFSKLILDGDYEPAADRILRIQTREGVIRAPYKRAIFDAVVGQAVVEAVNETFEPLFYDRSFGYRPQCSQRDMLARITASAEREERWVLAQGFIRDAFHSVCLHQLMFDLRRYIHDEALLRLVEIMLRGEKITRKNQARHGIDPRNPFSPIALNVRLHHVFDIQASESLLDWHRFAGHIAFPCRSTSEARHSLDQMVEILRRSEFKVESLEPVDLTKQRSELFGFKLGRHRDRMNFGLEHCDWDNLRVALNDANTTSDPATRAYNILNGWFDAMGPALEKSVDVSVHHAKSISAECGFRQFAGKQIDDMAKGAVDRWRQLLMHTVLPDRNYDGQRIGASRFRS